MTGRFHSELTCPLCNWGAYDMPLLSAVTFVRDNLREDHAAEEPAIPDAALEARFTEFWNRVVEEYSQ
ncbi:MAG: hypothetical protein KJZ87_21475 [Thermoguttaceae bacterium]|nr:hypothetical protein [Thermoguttaceae bacterium]